MFILDSEQVAMCKPVLDKQETEKNEWFCFFLLVTRILE